MFVVNKRQSLVLDLLRKHKHLTTQQIAEKVDVSDRTVRHDLLFLRKEFHQIEIRKGKHGGGIYWNE